MRERDVLTDRLWMIGVLTLSAVIVALVVRHISAMDDTAKGVRLALVGFLSGVGLVTLTSVGLDYLYRKRPRVWLWIKPSPLTVAIVAAVAFNLLVNPVRTSLRPSYLFGVLLWLHWTWKRFEREQDEDLEAMTRPPDEGEPGR